jgi:magnesium-transporting ATPase (P-type)
MTIVKFFMDGGEQGQEITLTPSAQLVFVDATAVNSNVSSDFNQEKQKRESVGSSSECALLQLLPRWEVNYVEIRQQSLPVVLHEFLSARKKMLTVVTHDGHLHTFLKSAPDFVLREAANSLTGDGEVHELTQDVRDSFLAKVAEFSDLALPSLLICSCDFAATERLPECDDPANVEMELTVIALVGIDDPPV